MLKISRLADYATVLMDYLAKHPEGTYSATVLTDATQIPVAAVSKTLKLLNKAGLLQSLRGPTGGYQLGRSAEEISVADIVTAIDGQPALTTCSASDKSCELDANCQLRGNWQLINRVVMRSFASISLASMGRELSPTEIPVRFHQRHQTKE